MRAEKDSQIYCKGEINIKQIQNGFADYYYLTIDGKVFNQKTKQYLKEDKCHRVKLKTIDNKIKGISIKELYLKVYDKEFCIDNIQSLENEKWRFIADTKGKYLVSNKGRIKSYCLYNAILLKPQITDKGYEKVEIYINKKRYRKFVHTLVADAYKEDCGIPKASDWQVHHLDYNCRNNNSKNLLWVSPAEHYKIHYIEKGKENE